MATTRAAKRNRAGGPRSRKQELLDEARRLGLDVSERDTVRRLETLIRYEVERRRSAAVPEPTAVTPPPALAAPPAAWVPLHEQPRRFGPLAKALSALLAIITSGAALGFLRFGYEDSQNTLSNRREELQAVGDDA